MSMTPPEAPHQQHSTRRAVLKVGAHAAWAVPAIQVVSAVTEYAAASGVVVPTRAADLAVTVTSQSQNGATLTLSVQVVSHNAGASGVVLTAGGSGTATPVTYGDVPLGGAGVTLPVTVTLDEKGDGVVALAAAGQTAGSALVTTGGGGTVFATAVLTRGTPVKTYTASSRSGSVSFTLTSKYAAAVVAWKASVTTAPQTGTNPALGTVTVPAGGTTTVTSPTWTWATNGNSGNGNGNGKGNGNGGSGSGGSIGGADGYTVSITGATTDNAGHGDVARPADATGKF